MENEIDSNKLMLHPERVAEWRSKGDCFPIYVEIGLTNLCNHKCIFCGLDWARGTNILNTDVLLENIKDMAKFGVKSICFSGAGEPLLHKDFSLIVKKTKELGIDVAFSTNIVLFDKEKAIQTLPYTSWIRFSLDAATPETHSKIHGTSSNDFERILNNLKNAVEIKKVNNYPVSLGVQFLLIEENSHEIIKAAELSKHLGVDNLQIKPYSQNPNSINRMDIDYNKFLKIKDKLEEFNTEDFQIFFRANRVESISNPRSYSVCYGLPFFAIINEKGNVVPCHMFYNNDEYSYGNIYEKKFSDIWKGEKRKQVIEKLRQQGIQDCKKGCRLDMINKYLYRLKNFGSNDNFI